MGVFSKPSSITAAARKPGTGKYCMPELQPSASTAAGLAALASAEATVAAVHAQHAIHTARSSSLWYLHAAPTEALTGYGVLPITWHHSASLLGLK